MEELRRLLDLVEWKKGFHSPEDARALLKSYEYKSGEGVAVSLAGLELGNRGMTTWADFAQEKHLHKSLNGLDVDRNRLGPAGLRSLIANLLEPMETKLTHLVLDNNRVGDEGAAALAHTLSTNVSLLNLSLYSNRIGDEGTRALAEGLMENRSLRFLNLNQNRLTKEGCEHLLGLLEANKELINIGIVGNRIPGEFAEVLEKRLEANWKKTEKRRGLHANLYATVVADNCQGPWLRSKLTILGAKGGWEDGDIAVSSV